MSDEKKAFWELQSASLNRSGDPEFYRLKADEHISVILGPDKLEGCIDLGCGAGEMLVFLAPQMNVEVGLDFSASMLKAAAVALESYPGIELVSADIFNYLPQCHQPVWMSTGAINQYLDEAESRRVLEIFKANSNAKALYYFDCIDPLRYRLMPYGLSYRPENVDRATSTAPGRRLARIVRRLQCALRFGLGDLSSPFQYLGSPAMGYGALPHFWLTAAARIGLKVEIVSSRYYEYRYHVIFRKA